MVGLDIFFLGLGLRGFLLVLSFFVPFFLFPFAVIVVLGETRGGRRMHVLYFDDGYFFLRFINAFFEGERRLLYLSFSEWFRRMAEQIR